MYAQTSSTPPELAARILNAIDTDGFIYRENALVRELGQMIRYDPDVWATNVGFVTEIWSPALAYFLSLAHYILIDENGGPIPRGGMYHQQLVIAYNRSTESPVDQAVFLLEKIVGLAKPGKELPGCLFIARAIRLSRQTLSSVPGMRKVVNMFVTKDWKDVTVSTLMYDALQSQLIKCREKDVSSTTPLDQLRKAANNADALVEALNKERCCPVSRRDTMALELLKDLRADDEMRVWFTIDLAMKAVNMADILIKELDKKRP